MANINLVFEVAFHGLMETTSPQLASVPAPEPCSPRLPTDHRFLTFSVLQCLYPAVCSHSGVQGWGLSRGANVEAWAPTFLGLCAPGCLFPHPPPRRQGLRQRTSPVPTKVCCLSLPPSPLLSLAHTHTPPLSPALWLLASILHCLQVSHTPLLGWLFTHLAPSDLSDFIPAFPLGTKLVVITFSTPCWAAALPS